MCGALGNAESMPQNINESRVPERKLGLEIANASYFGVPERIRDVRKAIDDPTTPKSALPKLQKEYILWQAGQQPRV